MFNITIILISLICGIGPSLIWLAFWLKEDEKHPEPNNLLLKTFLYGMLAVPISAVYQYFMSEWFLIGADLDKIVYAYYPLAIITLILWALIEELTKYLAAYFGGISKKANNEPVDAMVYMITAALGFAALENALYIFNHLSKNQELYALITTNLRFIGSTVLHIVSSATIGIFLSFSYKKLKTIKQKYFIYGLVLATILHTVFNSFIMRHKEFTLIGYSLVWLTAIFVIIIFEKVKQLKA